MLESLNTSIDSMTPAPEVLMITNYHAKYFAHELTRFGGSGVDRLGRALFDAQVDLNPHQIEAALFALRSPLSKGVLLADEVGLGKTIEAGLILCQLWAERKRNILVIVPAALRKQWEIELAEKFNLPSIVLDAKTFGDERRKGAPNPFRTSRVVICSLHFAAGQAELVNEVAWDLVVIDEAHKLRNAYRQSNRIGQRIRWATEGCRKVLLTATPLQNSLLELYGLSTLIDDHLFGEAASFRTQYMNHGGDLEGLRRRLEAFSWRTLRSQVTEYVRYTERRLITRQFTPTDMEHSLYQSISTYLQREGTYALPASQRQLLVLLVRKVLASSPHAVAGTLQTMRDRLVKLRDSIKAEKKYASREEAFDAILQGEIFDNDLMAELLEDIEDPTSDQASGLSELSLDDDEIDLHALEKEIAELDDYIRWAQSIGVDAKSRALLKSIEVGFRQMEEMGAARKVVIFTESRRTQEWLKNFLDGNGFLGQVLTFNGTNKDDATGRIYEEWLQENQGSTRISGSRQVNLRTAIIDRFRDQASIMIATEAGAEGLNLQFCAAVINFDLPWNPQRIEQRIGRCHRYGQRFDVVVINFLNERNAADRRVYELLEQKFRLFDGVFGASDEVIGTVESGIDFERRILEIYQACRTEVEIEAAFRALQGELDQQIQARMRETRKLLLEHFDEDVHERLRSSVTGTQEKLDRIGKLFWELTRHELREVAHFDDRSLTFDLISSPTPAAPNGRYSLISKAQQNTPDAQLYRLSHALGEYVIDQAKAAECPPAHVVFDITNHPTRIAVIEQLKGRSGWLSLQLMQIDALESQHYLLFSACDDEGKNLDQETCERLFNCNGIVTETHIAIDEGRQRLRPDEEQYVRATLARNMEENSKHFAAAREQLDKWAEDMEAAAQREIDDTKRSIREITRQSRQATTLQEQMALQEEISKLESKKRRLRTRLFDVEDEIAEKRDALIAGLQRRMEQKTRVTPLFTIRWSVA